MGNFKRSKYTDRESSFVTRNLIVKAGVVFVGPYLSKARAGEPPKCSRVRIVPPLSESGVENLILNPTSMPDQPLRDKIGDTFLNIEVVRRVGGNRGVSTDMITSVVSDVDPDKVRDGWTPYYEMTMHVRNIIKQAEAKRKLGLAVDIPDEWFAWMLDGDFEFSRLPLPNGHAFTDGKGVEHPEQYLVKCAAMVINGEPQRDIRANTPWLGPAVFMVPPNGASLFYSSITSRETEDQPLGTDNNKFGDFGSLAGGCPIEMFRTADSKYGLRLERKPMPLTIEQAKKLDQPWSALVTIPTVEQSIQWIAEALGDPRAVACGLRKTSLNPRSGSYERYLPAQWLKDAEPIAPEMAKDKFEQFMREKMAEKKESTITKPEGAPAGQQPAAQPAPQQQTPAPADKPAPPPFPLTDKAPAKPAAAKPAGFQPSTVNRPTGVDPHRYDDMLDQLRKQAEGSGADGLE